MSEKIEQQLIAQQTKINENLTKINNIDEQIETLKSAKKLLREEVKQARMFIAGVTFAQENAVSDDHDKKEDADNDNDIENEGQASGQLDSSGPGAVPTDQ